MFLKPDAKWLLTSVISVVSTVPASPTTSTIYTYLLCTFFLACDKCTQKLFDEIDKLSVTLKTTSILFDNYTTSSWNLLVNNIENYDKLNNKFVNVTKNVNNLIEKANKLDLDTRTREFQQKTAQSNKIAEADVQKTDNLYDKTNEFIRESKNLSQYLNSLINDINKFGNEKISIEEATMKAENILNKIKYTSNSIHSLQNNTVYNLCSRIKEEIKNIYVSSPNISYKNLDDIQYRLEDLMDINAHIEEDVNRANFLNENNSKRIQGLKTKIQQLKLKSDTVQNDVDEVLKKIEATNEILDQLEIVYESLLNISKTGEINILEKRIRRELVQSPEIEDMFLKSIEHVQELENKVNSYSR